MKRKINGPGGVGAPPRAKQSASDGNIINLKIPPRLPAELVTDAASSDPIAARAFRQLTSEQLAQRPRLLEHYCVRSPSALARIARDCQSFADRYGEACVIVDPTGTVLAFRAPS
jgi:hypothetical protein